MNIFSKTLAILALGASATGANAAIYYSDELVGYPLDELVRGYDNHYSNTLTNLFTGIDWGSEELVKAVIMFGFADGSQDGAEYVSAKAGSDNQQLALEVGNGYPNASAWDLDVDIEEATATSVEVNGRHPYNGEDYHDTYDYREAELGAAAKADIVNDGELDFKVTVDSGSTYIKTVQVKIETKTIPTTPPPVSVPDNGTTLILLGSALAGLAIARRKTR